MDRGTDAMERLTGSILNFKLGIVGVVNRCQAEHDKPLREVDENEEEFLMEHYPSIAEKHGRAQLIKVLSTVSN
jgi:dynamin 1-like protein